MFNKSLNFEFFFNRSLIWLKLLKLIDLLERNLNFISNKLSYVFSKFINFEKKNVNFGY